ncbi:Syntaxin-52 [Sarracenia purpurea var. burkii]
MSSSSSPEWFFEMPKSKTPKWVEEYIEQIGSMATSADSWIREYNEAVKVAEDINGMVFEKSSLSASGPEVQRHASSIRRKITILGTK